MESQKYITNTSIGYSVGRLGNQLFQFALLFTISKITGRKILLRFSQVNDIQLFKMYPHLLDMVTIEHAIDFDNSFKLIREKKHYTFDPSIFTEVALSSESIVSVHGYFQHPDYFKHCKDDIMQLFNLAKLPTSKCDDKFLNIGVHVRRGDYLQFSQHFITLDSEYYIRAVNELTPKDKRLGVVVHVFSDDIEWCKEHIKDCYVNRLNNRIIFHECDEYETLKEFANCDAHVISASTFSWWGAYLSGKNNVIGPDVWLGPGFGEVDTSGIQSIYKKITRNNLIVTMLYPLDPFVKSQHELSRGADYYINKIKHLKRIKNDILFFTDSNEVRTELSKNPIENVHVVYKPREELTPFRNIEYTKWGIKNAKFVVSPPNTSVPEYSCVMNSKADLILEAYHHINSRRVCNSKYYDFVTWMDCDVTPFTEEGKSYMITPSTVLIDKDIVIGNLVHKKPHVGTSLMDIQTGDQRHGWHCIAGGMLVGNIKVMEKFAKEWKDAALKYQHDGWIFVDQAVFSAAIASNELWINQLCGVTPTGEIKTWDDVWFNLQRKLAHIVDEDSNKK